MKSKTDAIRLRLRVKLDDVDYKAATWYGDTTKLIRELYGENWRLFAGFLASTSPRTQLKKNWRLADRIISAYIARGDDANKFGDVLATLMPSHLPNVIRTLQSRPLSGPKVYRFHKNLCGDLSGVTIDMWICIAYGIDPKQLTPRLYKRLEKKMIRDAATNGHKPANWQAVIWYAARRHAGKLEKSFVSVYRSIFCETPHFDFMQE
jgi:hypothetical protein